MTPDTAAGLISTLSLLKDLGAYGVLGAGIWLLLTGRVVTRGHLNDVVAAERAQVAKAEAREAEWARIAKRGTEDIAAPLAAEVSAQLKALRGG